MRFKTSDVACATTIVAVYAATLTLASGAYTDSLPLALIPQSALAATMLCAFWLAHRRLGRVIASWRRPGAWAAHVALPMAFLPISVVCAKLELANLPLMISLLVVGHVIALTSTPVVIGEHGVLSGPMFLSRWRYDFKLDREALQLLYRPNAGAPEWRRLNDGRLSVPTDTCECVAAVVAEWQANAE